MSEEKNKLKDVKVEDKNNIDKVQKKTDSDKFSASIDKANENNVTEVSKTSIENKDDTEVSSDNGINKVITQNEVEKETKKNIERKESPKDKTSRKKQTSSQANNNQKQKKSIDSQKSTDTRQNQQEPNSRNNEQGEYVEKLVSINRVAKVVKGGRRFSFAALVVVGDGNGMVGHGKGKAKEVPEAIKKATDEAKANMIRIPLRQGRTLHHDIKGRFDSGIVYLRTAPSGTGVIAGGPMRAVFEALGIQDIVAKSVGTSNPHNMVRATFEALKSASSPKIIAMRRGLKINDITKRRKISQIGNDNAKN